MQSTSSQGRRLRKTSTHGIYARGARYVVVFCDPQGRQRKRSARTLAEAREIKAGLTADVKRGEYRAPEPTESGPTSGSEVAEGRNSQAQPNPTETAVAY